MKKTFFALFFSVAALSVCFSLAYGEAVQEGSGGGGGDTSSAGYQVKTAVADPGVSTSQSANFTYNHGTLWFDDGSADSASVPPPPVSGSGGGSSGGSSSAPASESSGGSQGGGGSSGSGWVASFFSSDPNPQIGGVSPAADDVPFTTAPHPALRAEEAPQAIARILESPYPTPRIFRVVDDAGVAREFAIVFVKRVIPWWLYLALALILFGIVALAVFVAGRGNRAWLLRIACACILTGLAIGLVGRFAYRPVPPDMRTIASSQTVPASQANAAVRKLREELPLGAHTIAITDGWGRKTLGIRVFITPVLPF